MIRRTLIAIAFDGWDWGEVSWAGRDVICGTEQLKHVEMDRDKQYWLCMSLEHPDDVPWCHTFECWHCRDDDGHFMNFDFQEEMEVFSKFHELVEELVPYWEDDHVYFWFEETKDGNVYSCQSWR